MSQFTDAEWEELVRTRNENACVGCGSKMNLSVRHILPPNLGGPNTPQNGYTICRKCALTLDQHKSASKNRRPINFWVPGRLHRDVREVNGFASVSALVRSLMSNHVFFQEQFDTLGLYQGPPDGDDEGLPSVKVNVWVDAPIYEAFKEQASMAGKSVTELISNLLEMYVATSGEQAA